MNKTIFTISKDCLPQVSSKYPFIYLEHGRLEIDDRSVKFIDSNCVITSIPCGVINCILLGPGTSITHDAIKILSEFNCHVFWVGEDGIRFYASGISPTNNTKNFNRQIEHACSKKRSLEIVRKMFNKRFPNEDISNKTLEQLRGMEGIRIKNLYKKMSDKYKVSWTFRDANLTDFNFQDDTNKFLTIFNMYLYAVLCSATLSMGFSPYVGFVHRNSPLPFIYDMADLYKEDLCIEPAFRLTNTYTFSKENCIIEFIENSNKFKLLDKFSKDLVDLFNLKTELSTKINFSEDN